jgi:hypothetical protein
MHHPLGQHRSLARPLTRRTPTPKHARACAALACNVPPLAALKQPPATHFSRTRLEKFSTLSNARTAQLRAAPRWSADERANAELRASEVRG